jgi:hypothetical protein
MRWPLIGLIALGGCGLGDLSHAFDFPPQISMTITDDGSDRLQVTACSENWGFCSESTLGDSLAVRTTGALVRLQFENGLGGGSYDGSVPAADEVTVFWNDPTIGLSSLPVTMPAPFEVTPPAQTVYGNVESVTLIASVENVDWEVNLACASSGSIIPLGHGAMLVVPVSSFAPRGDCTGTFSARHAGAAIDLGLAGNVTPEVVRTIGPLQFH